MPEIFTDLELKALIIVATSTVVGNDLGGMEFVSKLDKCLAGGNVLHIQGPKIGEQ